MIAFRKNRIIAVMTLLGFTLTSCADSAAQEVSRTMHSETIIAYSEYDSNVQNEMEISDEVKEETSPSWGGGPSHKPKEFAFNLVLGEDLLIVDYGKSAANVYQAEYSEDRPFWGEEWYEAIFFEIQEWCIGIPVMYSSSADNGVNNFAVQDHKTSLQNLRSVELITIDSIDEYEEVVRRQGIKSNSKVLCWTFAIKDFPTQIADYNGVEAPADLDTIKYMRVCPQYVDDLPVYGKCTFCGVDTFEWPGVMGPSCSAYEGNTEIVRVNPSYTCMFDIERRTYSIKATVQSNISIVDPTTCVEEIEKALRYDPCAVAAHSADPQKEDMYHIWEKDVEVYCMELAYAAFDTSYPKRDATEEELRQHDLFLIPVWEVYYVVTNPDNELTISSGLVMINALTGESLFSDEYGPFENTQ